MSGDASFGTAEAYIDGTLVETIEAYASDGWNQPVTIILMDEETSAPHTFELQMAEGEEDKAFTIDILGYTP